ncbi:MAG TPA: malto-oligosyltrehalose trehalohydrolase [Streptosporangiaceae bacterium]|jgi:maltooligosyltrehalose trehalohydrolase
MTAFRVWAPAAATVEVETNGRRQPMTRAGEWWHADAGGTDYAFRIDGGDPLPDPRSLRQPTGVTGPSRVYDHDEFRWTDDGWPGSTVYGSVIYELHIGTFTADGTFDAAIAKLGYLAGLGVTAVELMPVATFPGQHGWGYDGINLWAVHEPYGGPDGLKRFVDAAHAHGLAVVLDVVYNHVGIGNRLADFGPYFTSAHTTPWGPAVNLDQRGSDEVRAFLIGNALMWLREFHIDGLRLDAVHAMQDDRALPFLEELANAARGLPNRFLIAESDLNDPRILTGDRLDAQWNDDFHHSLHAALTGERQGYYADFGSMAGLAKTFTSAFFHNDTWSSFRGRTHGREVDVSVVYGYRFLGYLQDHDQIGNRATGDRITATLDLDLAKVGAGLVLTSPFTPMLFMGEEWAASTPWQYFTDHIEAWLAKAVSDGRKAEFATHGWTGDVPDPQDQGTFLCSKLDWSEPGREPHASMLAWYRELIALRRRTPELTDPRLDRLSADYDEQARWILLHRGDLRVAANLSTRPVTIPVAGQHTTVLLASQPGVQLDRDSVTLPPATFTCFR